MRGITNATLDHAPFDIYMYVCVRLSAWSPSAPPQISDLAGIFKEFGEVLTVSQREKRRGCEANLRPGSVAVDQYSGSDDAREVLIFHDVRIASTAASRSFSIGTSVFGQLRTLTTTRQTSPMLPILPAAP